MGPAKEAAVKGYIHLPSGIRKRIDPLIKNRAKHQQTINKYFNAEKGKQALKGSIRNLFGGKKRRHRK